MALPDMFMLRAVWGGRVEPAAQITGRVWDTITALASHGGVLALPWWSVGDTPVVVSDSREHLDVYTLPKARARHAILLTQYPDSRDPKAPPHAVATITAGIPEGLGASNQIVITLATTAYTTPGCCFPPTRSCPTRPAWWKPSRVSGSLTTPA